MSTVDSLLDLGEPAPSTAPNQTNNAGDPFDPLSPSTGSSGSTKSPDQEPSLDPFDPFAAASANMSAANGTMSDDQVKTMEQQFDDLLDLGGFSSTTEVTTTTTKTSTNGDLLGDFESVETPGSPTGDVVSVTRELGDGTTIVETTTTTTTDSEEYVDLDIVNGTNNSEEGGFDSTDSKVSTEVDADKTGEDLKAVDLMKARYQGQHPKSRTKIIREPKKLEHSFLKQGEEGEDGGFLKTGKLPEHKEGTAELKLLSGIDYSKSKYESLVSQEKEPVCPTSPTEPVPVNRKPIEKVAPPEIAQNLRALFESGELPDKHKVKKMDIDTKGAPDSGVYENKPTTRPDLVRATDEKQKCDFESGRIKNISSMWGKQEETVKKKGPIKLVEEGTGPAVLESEPTVRDDVVHGSAVPEKDHVQIESGKAKAMRESFQRSQEDKPKERKEIKLYEDGEGASPAVLESEPTVRDDLVHGSAVQEKDFTNIESGKAKALRESFLKSQEDQPKERKQIKLFEEGDVAPAVLESEPVVRDDLVQSSAVQEKDFTRIESGKARALRESFLKSQEDKPKERKQIKLFEEGDASPAVVESQPAQAAEGVVRAEDEAPEDATFVRGNIASKTGFFAKAATQTSEPGCRKPINIHEGAEEEVVRESEPKVLEGVVRSSDTNSALSVEKGKAKNLKGHFQNLTEQQQETYRGEKKQVQLDMDSGPAVIENEPTVRPDVVRSGELSSDVLFSKRGHARNTAKQFLSQQDSPRGPKQPIQLDIADGPAVIENVPAAGDENVVRSSYEPAVRQIEKGNVHGALSFLQKAQEEENKVKTSAEKQAQWLQEIEAGKATQEALLELHDQERLERNRPKKPQWQLELEAAKAAQPATEEEEENRREVTQAEYGVDDQLELLRRQKAKNLKAMFQQLEQEADQGPVCEPPRQLVRFTPPREVTPERQQVYQEVERNKPKEMPLPEWVPPPDVPITSSANLVFSQGQPGHL